MKAENQLWVKNPKTLFGLAAAATLIGVQACGTEETKENERPNILYIMSDDHGFQAISAYGHPISQLAPTPNIDRIAQEGILFNRNYCANSLSGPSRANCLTGMHSHKNGFKHNGERFEYAVPTYPEILHENGYETAVVGKWHLKNQPRGFDYWRILNGQGTYYNPKFISENDTVVHEGYVTDIITDMTLDWLKSREESDKPFCMVMQHKAPHRNWFPAKRHMNMFDSTDFPVPDTYWDDYEGRIAAQQQEMSVIKDMTMGYDLKLTVSRDSDEIIKDLWWSEYQGFNDEQKQVWDDNHRDRNQAYYDSDFTEEEKAIWKFQRYMQDYLGCVAAVDESVGKVLDYLEQTGEIDNTIIVYTSDQGFYMGEHGWFDKRFMYEESYRMPLMIMYPKGIKKGQVSEALTQNIDFAPTFLDYAGLDIPEEIQGRSLRPVLEGKDLSDWRTSLYYHYYEYPAVHMVKKHEGVSTDRYKLIHFYDDIDEWELYDIQEDPKELSNLINDSTYDQIEEDMRHQLDSLKVMYEVDGV